MISTKTLLRRELLRVFRIWPQTILAPVASVLLYLLVFGKLIGNLVGPLQGITYIEYILPGLIMMAIVNNAYENVAWSFFSTKFQCSNEELLISPITKQNIILGYILGGVLRGLLVAALVMIFSGFFSSFSILHQKTTFIVSILAAILFALAGLLNGLFAQKFDDLAIVPNYILAPLTYLSGIFYSIDLLSPFFQKLIYFNPIFYLADAFKFAFLGVNDVKISLSLSIIAFYIIILYCLCLIFIHDGMRNYRSIYANS